VNELHVVVGAGAVGTRTAVLLAERGHRVRLVSRSGGGPESAGVERVAADAADRARLVELTRGAAAIYNAVNPPYHRWPQDWPPIATALLAAAEAAGAVLVTCSNLYGYGPVDGPMTEDLPLAATGPKGRVRARMWEDALAAHVAGRVRATEARPSSYLGHGSQSMVGDRVLPRAARGRRAWLLGDPDQPHTFSHPADVARTLVVLGADERAWGRPWHVPSNAPTTQRRVVEDVCDAMGVPRVPVSRTPRGLLTAMGAMSPLLREFGEVRHQYERPWVLDDSRARQTFGLAPTPWAEIVAELAATYRPAGSPPSPAAASSAA
jgi:nucleoside-diphosphate-sugar epimerase